MDTTNAVSLQLTASGMETYCRDLARRSATIEKQVSALDAIATFISSQANPGEQAKGEFSAIKQILRDEFERARAALLEERALQLQKNFSSQKLAQIAALYTSVSRDAFWEILTRVAQTLDASTSNTLRVWVSEWLADAQRRARQASPYPDVIDFKHANIDSAEYLSMADIGRFFGVVT